jgi:rubrerythrin
VSVRVDVDATKALLRTLRSHDANEGALLEAYRAVAEGDPDPGVRYLAQLIIDDEERHHALLEEMASQVESWANGVGGPGTPPLSPRVDRALLETTRQLIAREREDAKELRRLRRDLHQVAKTSLLPLLVELMLHDTAKHIEILHFVRDYTG